MTALQPELGDLKAQADAEQRRIWHREIRQRFADQGIAIFYVRGAWRFGWVELHSRRLPPQLQVAVALWIPMGSP